VLGEGPEASPPEFFFKLKDPSAHFYAYKGRKINTMNDEHNVSSFNCSPTYCVKLPQTQADDGKPN